MIYNASKVISSAPLRHAYIPIQTKIITIIIKNRKKKFVTLQYVRLVECIVAHDIFEMRVHL